MRKDLSLKRAQQVSLIHEAKYSKSVIVQIYTSEEANREVSSAKKDVDSLRGDSVGELVCDYGQLGSKIESLAQLKTLKGARAEVAMMSLARGYVNNCANRNSNWTSGLHLYWWTKKQLPEIPEISVGDIRTTNGIQLARQVDLTAWSIVMLRLTLIDDVIQYAASCDDPLGEANGLLQKAAEAVQIFNLQKLSKWLRTNALPTLDRMLSYDRYVELSNQLHKDTNNIPDIR
ncbi:MAG: hypothetical protein KGZ69_11150 [Methylomonas sp.]|nr:hypothetical protein [Methylomonas sp.]